MKLAVDSGSTKTDWGFFNTPSDLEVLKTQGINPCHQSADEIHSILSRELLPQTGGMDMNHVTEVFFYGSGCATSAICSQMSAILKDYFPAAAITVESDMLGAARAAVLRVWHVSWAQAPTLACMTGRALLTRYPHWVISWAMKAAVRHWDAVS